MKYQRISLLVVACLAVFLMATTDPDLDPKLKDMLGKDAPDFSLQSLDGNTVKLSQAKGSPVVIDMWATWCGPCVHSLPELDQLYKENQAKGLKVFAVNLQEDKEKVSAFVKQKGWSLPVLLDSNGSVAQSYKAEAIPETIVIGKDGKVLDIFVGSGHHDQIAELVSKALQ